MKQELSVLSKELVSNIILKGDLSGLTKEQRVEYVAYRSKAVGLDPATQAFILMENRTTGAVTVYATKEAAAQLNQNRQLSPVVAKEEFLLDNTIFKVTYRVTENGRTTEDCGAVGLVKVKKQAGKEDEIRKLSPDEVADAIMKAHTKAKRRTILTHCGIGTNDADEPVYVVDDEPKKPQKEEIKDAQATVKDAPKEEPAKLAEEFIDEKIIGVEDLKLPGGRPAWEFTGMKGIYRSSDQAARDFVKEHEGKEIKLKFSVNGKGTKVVTGMKEIGV